MIRPDRRIGADGVQTDSGLSLVELVLALAVGAMVLTAAADLFIGTSRLLTWMGVRADVGTAALLGLNRLSRELRLSAYDSLTISTTPNLQMSFLQEDPTAVDLTVFVPAQSFTIYYFDGKHSFVRKTWQGTMTPDPFAAGRMTVPQLASVVAIHNGTELTMGGAIVAATADPPQFPTTWPVNGITISLTAQETDELHQIQQQVQTTVFPEEPFVRRGFSLVEVVTAVGLLSIIILAVVSSFPSSMASMKKSGSITVANDLARQQLEIWREQDFGTLVLTTTPQTVVQIINGVTYTIVITVKDVDPPDANVKQVDSVVTWTVGEVGGAGRVQYSTCVYNELNPW